jgi:hypothetical protein
VPSGWVELGNIYRRIAGDSRQFAELVREKKLLVMERLFGGELASLAHGLSSVTGLAHAAARRAIAEVTASMDVYRTYTRGPQVSPADRRRVMEAATDALQRTLEPELRDAIGVLRSLVLLEDGTEADARLDWVMQWQQFTGPVELLSTFRMIASISLSYTSFFLSASFLKLWKARFVSNSSSSKPSSRTRSRNACRPLCLPRTRLDRLSPTSSGRMIS